MILTETLHGARYALRIFKRRPAFTAAALSTLILGIALNTVTFGIVNALWFRPLPFPNGDRLTVLYEFNPKANLGAFTSLPTFRDWRDESRSFESMTAVLQRSFNLSLTREGAGAPAIVDGALVQPGGIEFMGFRPLMGRSFVAGDEKAAVRPVLIGARLWEDRFDSDPGAVGREVTLDGEPAAIVGVLPFRFQMLYGGYEVIAPLDESTAGLDRTERSLHVLARLKPGATLEAARAEMLVIAARLASEYPDSQRDWEARVSDYRRFLYADAIRMYPQLLTASVLVLLIVCANISNLYLAQAIGRRRETALRVALGARRSQIVRQMLTEGWLLAAVGGAIAIVLVIWIRQMLVAAYPELVDLRADLRVFAYTAMVSLLAGTVFGLTPALAASKPDINEVLKGGGHTSQSPRSYRLRRLLVISELALSLMLLVAAGLLVRTALRMRTVDPGFSTRNVLTMHLTLRGGRYADASQRAAFTELLRQRLAAVSGVEGVTFMGLLPLVGAAPPARLEASDSPGVSWQMFVRPVDAEFHQVMGNPLAAGRAIQASDSAASELVVVLNRTAAEKLSPGDPRAVLDRQVRINGGPWKRVVGVAEGVRQILTQPPLAEIQVPLAQEQPADLWIAARVHGDIPSVSESLRRELAAIDPALPSGTLATMDEIVAGNFPRVMIVGLLGFALVALTIASLGLYGVVASMVAERTREIGIRIALGADARAVRWNVVKDSLQLAGWGIAAGLLGAFALARGMAGLLYGVSPSDPAVFALVPLALVAVVIASAYLPARRASRISPIVALREE